jgi:ATP-dependent DNA ligase
MAVALPACFVVFDLLARQGVDLRTRPYHKRRRALEKLLDRHLPDRVVLMPMTTDLAAAHLWMVDHCAAGIEGVVAKRLDQAYGPAGAAGARSAPARQPKRSWAACSARSSSPTR